MLFAARILRLLIVLIFSFLAEQSLAQKVRIICVGNSITAGAKLNDPPKESYPAQLQVLLGNQYEVFNLGVSGKTVIAANGYANTPSFKEALLSDPNIVFIMLGTNDSRLPYRLDVPERFDSDYKSIIHAFKELPSSPRIILLLPVTSYLTDTTRQTDSVITNLIIPHIQQIAYDEKLELIDMHSITLNKATLFPDQLHPSTDGAAIIARRLYEAVTQKPAKSFDIFKKIDSTFKVSSFYGYECADFYFEGRSAKIVKPRIIAKGRPWVWRARFWGHEPQTDIALLDRGFHIVYCDVAELFGNTEAIAIWNKFYAFLKGAGLSKKALMEGMSRGGVYIYNWAAANPKKVAGIYADAPVLDLRSWPGGKLKGHGSAADWEIFKKDYGYTTEEQTNNFKNNPLDKITDIVKGRYPMLHVVGDADEIVPVDENTAIFEKKIKAAGGNIQVIHKPGIGHHPHSLPDPQPIVDFILKAVNYN